MKSAGRHRGFTLIEILVVVMIVGIVMSVAVLAVSLVGSNKQLDTEATRMVSLLDVARDESMLQGREFGVEFMTGAYRFVEYDPLTTRWTEILGDDTLRLRQLPEDVELNLFLEDQRVLLEVDPADTGGDDDAPRFGRTEAYAPHVLIFSSGDMTPFELHFLQAFSDQSIVLRSDFTGVTEIVTDEE